jgi:hypothetical protein
MHPAWRRLQTIADDPPTNVLQALAIDFETDVDADTGPDCSRVEQC